MLYKKYEPSVVGNISVSQLLLPGRVQRASEEKAVFELVSQRMQTKKKDKFWAILGMQNNLRESWVWANNGLFPNVYVKSRDLDLIF